MTPIRLCTHDDFFAVAEIINDSAHAYAGVIPADRLPSPYMSEDYACGTNLPQA